MQKQESQARQNNNSLFTSIIRQSQGLLVPPQELQIFFWASSLSCFANTKAPTRGKKLTACWEAAHRPSRVGIRRLMKTSPYYLTTSNQKVVHKLITHSETLSLALSLKSLPGTIRVQILWVWAAHSYCLTPTLGTCNQHHTFLHLVSACWLYCWQTRRLKFGSVIVHIWNIPLFPKHHTAFMVSTLHKLFSLTCNALPFLSAKVIAFLMNH